jgi:hypothetical protein
VLARERLVGVHEPMNRRSSLRSVIFSPPSKPKYSISLPRRDPPWLVSSEAARTAASAASNPRSFNLDLSQPGARYWITASSFSIWGGCRGGPGSLRNQDFSVRFCRESLGFLRRAACARRPARAYACGERHVERLRCKCQSVPIALQT